MDTAMFGIRARSRKRFLRIFLFNGLFRSLLLGCLILSCDTHLSGEPPLHRAAYKGDVETIKTLIKEGESIHGLNSEGATPLHWAAFKGQTEAAKLLLKYGADVNAITKKGSTPLRLATTHKKEKMIQLLKTYGGEAE